MTQILVVCTANICRSPVGAALLQDRLHQRGITEWQVRSAGTWAQQKRGASQYSVEIMAEQGFDINDHQAEMIELPHMQQADLVLCMESGHVEALKAEFPEHGHKVYLISEMAGMHYSISDPYGQPKDDYYRMVEGLTQVIDTGLDRIIAEAAAHAQE
ncbi:MAG: hypothetical protein R6X34_13625 [Chloroflexota bacterium]|jgi:protein-tyrosine phosphatase